MRFKTSSSSIIFNHFQSVRMNKRCKTIELLIENLEKLYINSQNLHILIRDTR